jgi:hypothetical protein
MSESLESFLESSSAPSSAPIALEYPSTQQTQKQAHSSAFFSGVLLLTLLAIGLRLAVMPHFLESKDGVFFTRGILDYNLPKLQPQWPGYPVYIWLGKGLNALLHEPTLALHVLSALGSGLCTPLIALLARAWKTAVGATLLEAQRTGLWAALLWLACPMALLAGTEIYSDSTALFFALLQLAVLIWAASKQKFWAVLLAGLIAALMVGARLSYLPLIFANLPLLALFPRAKQRYTAAALYTLTFVLGGILWLAWQIYMDGLGGFLSATRVHLSGHYTEWGESINTDPHLLERPWRAISTLGIYGFGLLLTPSWSPLHFISTLAWAGLVFLGMGKKTVPETAKSTATLAARVAYAWFGIYTLWVFLSHDVGLDRYWLPIVVGLILVLAVRLPEQVQKAPRFAYGTALCVLSIVGCGITLAIQRNQNPPLQVRFAQYLQKYLQKDAMVMLPDESSLVKSYAAKINIIKLNNDPQTWWATGYALSPRGEVYALLPSDPTQLNYWQPITKICKNPLLRTREWTQLTLYHFLPQPQNTIPKALECS